LPVLEVVVADWDTLARFPADRDPGALIRRHGLDHGLLLYSRRQNAGQFGDWLLIAPPLVIDEAGRDELLAGLRATLDAAAPELS
jgi:adenosylmethionine-8-amino-7-oxononanoate aminotransferase